MTVWVSGGQIEMYSQQLVSKSCKQAAPAGVALPGDSTEKVTQSFRSR